MDENQREVNELLLQNMDLRGQVGLLQAELNSRFSNAQTVLARSVMDLQERMMALEARVFPGSATSPEVVEPTPNEETEGTL